jgi:dinuclear metal center YbgI/SA1388 family protein
MKKATIKNIAAFLNKELGVRAVKDSSANGLQVRSRTTGDIRKVGFAVDACISTFGMAKKQGVDLLVVHHGIKWRPQKDRALAKLREAYLKEQNLALYAAHLPLDLHAEYGNNVQLCRILGLTDVRKFGRYHGVRIGFEGAFARPMRLGDAASYLNSGLRTRCRVFRFGKDRIRRVGIISGGGGSMLKDAVLRNLDCFLVGELDLAAHNAAKDCGMNVIAAGHYKTETVGVKALMPLINETFGVETVFIEDEKDL